MMKILFVHPYFHIRTGSGKLMFSEAELLKNKGHEVYFFTTNKTPFMDDYYPYRKYFTRHIDYKTARLPLLLPNLTRPLYNKEVLRKLGLLIQEVQPDVVHVHGTGPHLSDTVLKAAHEHNIPIVTTIHGSGFFCPAGTFMKKRKQICDDKDCIRGNYLKSLIYGCAKKPLRIQLPYLACYSLNRSLLGYEKYIKKFICPSQALKKIAQDAGLPQEKLEIVYNFNEVRDMEYQEGSYFLYIGRFDEEKGVHYLIEAMKKLPKNIQLHIVGKGAEEKRLRTMAKGLNNITFKGFLKGETLENEYRNCIATILPCNWFEVFGLTITESFAYAKPAIASNVGGVPEIIEDGINGILTEPGNPRSIAEAISKLSKDPELVRKMGENGREKVRKLFSSENHYQRLIEVYEQVADIIY